MRSPLLVLPLFLVACGPVTTTPIVLSDGGTPLTLEDGGSAVMLEDGGVVPVFSFFVTSLTALQELSGNQQGFGGDLRCISRFIFGLSNG